MTPPPFGDVAGGGAGDGPAQFECGGGATSALAVQHLSQHPSHHGDWRATWADSLDALAAVASGSGGLAPCVLALPCGHTCGRAAHLPPDRGGCLGCMCPVCGEDVQTAEAERRRWRPLQEALNMRSRLHGGNDLFDAPPSPVVGDGKTALRVSASAAAGVPPPSVFSPTAARLPATLGGTMPAEKEANLPYVTQ
eukprot:scaffold7678_cov88-Isochrysis_galbana.AAC.2